MQIKPRELSYPERLTLAQLPTPLQPMQRLARALNFKGRLWVKRDDLTGSHLSGNKIRKLEFLVAEARSQQCDVLVTCGGVQSNHCRATALLAAQEGLACHLILRGDEPDQADGNLLLDQLAGATVSFYPSHSFQDNLSGYFDTVRAHYAAQGRRAYCIPTGGSNATGLWGYIAAAQELHAQCLDLAIKPAQIITATGSGGTQAGLTLGAVLSGLETRVLGMAVCDDAAWFNAKVAQDIRDWQAQFPTLAAHNLAQAGLTVDSVQAHTCDDFIGPGYARADQDVFETIKLAARTEGFILDPVYTGKAFHGMLQQIKCGALASAEDIVFVHTGGLFGVFPQRSQFHF